jgi:hypothetical protein
MISFVVSEPVVFSVKKWPGTFPAIFFELLPAFMLQFSYGMLTQACCIVLCRVSAGTVL